MRKIYLLLVLLVFGWMTVSSVVGQNPEDWWNIKHDWDGVTHWSEYIVVAPGYMGPNALPVSRSKKGVLPQKPLWDNSIDLHFSDGDNTQNHASRLYLPFAQGRVAVEVSMVTLEHYKMDTLTRDFRRARDYEGKGFAVGDLCFWTGVQLVKNQAFWPDLLLEVNFRTASGTQLRNARYTDAMAYDFALSFGKTLPFKWMGFRSFRWHGAGGFYSWQTYFNDSRQNDAPSYAVGFQLIGEAFEMNSELAGYYGYMGRGDRPLVYRLELKIPTENWEFEIAYQYGIHDFDYQSIRFSIGRQLKFMNRWLKG